MLNSIGIIGLIKDKLDYIAQRHNILASNIANVNTPKRRKKDLEPFSLENYYGNGTGLGMVRTQDSHIGHYRKNKFKVIYPRSSITKIDGNNISIEEETMKLNSNNLEHQKAVSLYGKIVSMFQTAARNGK